MEFWYVWFALPAAGAPCVFIYPSIRTTIDDCALKWAYFTRTSATGASCGNSVSGMVSTPLSIHFVSASASKERTGTTASPSVGRLLNAYSSTPSMVPDS